MWGDKEKCPKTRLSSTMELNDKKIIFVHKTTGHRPDQIVIKPLAGDASMRRYYRVFLKGGAPSSIILMERQAHGKNSPAEEIGPQIDCDDIPFINILNFLRKNNIPVPSLISANEERSLLLISDEGDKTLFDHLMHFPADKKKFYIRAVDILLHLQSLKDDGSCMAFQRSFDRDLFTWEFMHFIEYCLEHRGGQRFSNTERAQVENEFSRLSAILADGPKVLCHRDFHSKNLMINSKKDLSLIDFQDALLGPPEYDLASLLNDSYMTFTDNQREELLKRYYKDISEEQLFRYKLAALQRNMKAAGRFHYILEVKGKDTHVKFIAPTLKMILKNIDAHSEFSKISSLLKSRIEDVLASEDNK